jgi:hypothetical protein
VATSWQGEGPSDISKGYSFQNAIIINLHVYRKCGVSCSGHISAGSCVNEIQIRIGLRTRAKAEHCAEEAERWEEKTGTFHWS